MNGDDITSLTEFWGEGRVRESTRSQNGAWITGGPCRIRSRDVIFTVCEASGRVQAGNVP